MHLDERVISVQARPKCMWMSEYVCRIVVVICTGHVVEWTRAGSGLQSNARRPGVCVGHT